MLISLFNLSGGTGLACCLGLRCVLAFFMALALSLLFGKRLIYFLHQLQKKGQPIR